MRFLVKAVTTVEEVVVEKRKDKCVILLSTEGNNSVKTSDSKNNRYK